MTGKISEDADKVVDGTEKVAASLGGVNYGILISSILTFFRKSPITTPAPAVKTANYSMVATDAALIFNGAGSLTLTLQAASSYPGRWLLVKTIAAQTVVSAASNVVPLDGGSAGTAILAATAGK